jgi:hypothetical protein
MNSISALRSFSVALINDVYIICTTEYPLVGPDYQHLFPPHIVWMTETLLYFCLMTNCNVFRSK